MGINHRSARLRFGLDVSHDRTQVALDVWTEDFLASAVRFLFNFNPPRSVTGPDPSQCKGRVPFEGRALLCFRGLQGRAMDSVCPRG